MARPDFVSSGGQLLSVRRSERATLRTFGVRASTLNTQEPLGQKLRLWFLNYQCTSLGKTNPTVHVTLPE